jgi:hypothetical protein
MIMLKKGSEGRLVMYMQGRLRKMGESVPVSGYFCERTRCAVVDFQVRCGLRADGVVGDKTWGVLLTTGGELTGGDVAVKAEVLEMAERMLEENSASELGAALVLTAWGYLGCQERPWGSNKGTDIVSLVQGTAVTGVTDLKHSEYKKSWGISQPWVFPPWCAIAVSSWMAEAFEAGSWSDIPFGAWFGGVTQTMNWAKRSGCWRDDVGSWARSGELFVMGRAGSGSDESERGVTTGAGHIGIVAWDDGEYIVTVEGNAGNAVRTKRRLKADMMGFVDWEKVWKGKKKKG